MKKRVGILTGGTSSEREIAIESSKFVKDTLHGYCTVLYYDFPKDLNKFLPDYKSIDVAIPVFHGRGGEDGVIQGFLRVLEIPFLFSDVEAQVLASNKSLCKGLVEKVGINTPDSRVVVKSDTLIFIDPVVVKPIDGGSSIGTAVVKDKDFLQKALEEAFLQSERVLVERYIVGDEYSVPVVETKDGIIALPVIAIKPKADFFDLKSKYDPTLVDEICPANISNILARDLSEAALKAHQTIGAKHISRSDFIVDKKGKIWFLELNTIPGMTVNSLVPKALKVANIKFEDLLVSWIEKI